MKKSTIIIGIIALIVIIFVVAQSSYKKSDEKGQREDTNQAALLEVRENDWVAGNPAATVTVIEYLDFECEACGAYYPVTSQLKEEYKDDIRFAVRYFPLPGHKNSKTAAYAAEAAGKQGKFWEMYDVLFQNQKQWGEQQFANQDQFEKYAVEAGLDVEQWKADVKSSEVRDRVDGSYTEAKRLGLSGTPSFFLNGIKIENPRGYDAFKKVIDDELQKQQ
jgi:protein-disulfide isomerase